MSEVLTKKFVAVLNKKIEPGKLMNALAHMAAGLAGGYPDKAELRLANYTDKDGQAHPNISDYPFIVLAADNSNKLRTLRATLQQTDLAWVDFTQLMTVGTYLEQHESMRATPESELEYYGVCIFGETEKINPLTKKFSLWR